jgi:phosphatidylinositol alpha-1,6-mannosyltransferase
VAGSGLAAPMAWLAARASGARYTVYLHGLDVIAPSRIYQRAWLPFVRAADGVLVNSHHTAALARSRGVGAERIAVLHPGVESAVPADADGARFRQRHGLGDGPLLLSVGRLSPRKGLVEFIGGALPVIVAARPDAVLAVVGEEAHDALHGGGGAQRERIEAAARAVGLADRVRLLGRCDEAGLADAYAAADCHVFPVLELPGDVEGFGMVAVEAAAHGVPTVAFRVGGVPDAVAEGRTGALVAPGDYAAFAAATLGQLRRGDAPEVADRCRAFARGLDWSVFGVRLRALLRGGDA